MTFKLGEALIKLTGGRPMLYKSLAFIDKVSGKSVYKWTDRLGREWLAESAWALFRVEVGGIEAPMSDSRPWARLWDLCKLRYKPTPSTCTARTWDEEFPTSLYKEFGYWFARLPEDIGDHQFSNREAAVAYLRHRNGS